MSTHTPGPWEVSYSTNFPDQQTIQAVGSDRILALIDCNDEQDEANAAFIVRACNSHEAMLEALKDCLTSEECTSIRMKDPEKLIRRLQVINDRVHEAIRLTEGKA